MSEILYYWINFRLLNLHYQISSNHDWVSPLILVSKDETSSYSRLQAKPYHISKESSVRHERLSWSQMAMYPYVQISVAQIAKFWMSHISALERSHKHHVVNRNFLYIQDILLCETIDDTPQIVVVVLVLHVCRIVSTLCLSITSSAKYAWEYFQTTQHTNILDLIVKLMLINW